MFEKLPRPSLQLALAAGGVVAFVLLLLSSEFLGEKLCEKIIRQNGFPEAHIDGFSLSPRGIFIDTISLDRNEFSTAEGIFLEINWMDFLAHWRIESIKVKDISLSGEMNESGQYKIAGWDASMPHLSSSDKRQKGGVSSLIVDGINIDMDTEYGNIRLSGKISYQNSSKTEETTFQSSFWARQKQLSFSASLNGEKKKNDPAWVYSCEWQDGRIELPEIQALRVSGWVEFGRASKAGQISVGSVKHKNMTLQNLDIVIDTAKEDMAFFKTSPAGFPGVVLIGAWSQSSELPIRLEVSAQKPVELFELFHSEQERSSELLSALPPLTFIARSSWENLSLGQNVTADWTLNPESERLKAEGKIGFNLASRTGWIRVNPLSLEASSLGFLSVLTDNKLELISGQITPSGDLTFSPQAPLKGSMSFAIKNIKGKYDQTPFEGLSGVIPFSNITPASWRIDPAGEISLTQVGKGNILRDGKVTLSGNSEEGLLWKKADFSSSGGSVIFRPFDEKNVSSQKSELVLRDIDMEKLAAIAEIDGLKAIGKIEGNLPMERGAQGVVVRGGVVRSIGPGEFSYAPSSFPSALQGEDSRMKTVREALRHFQFDQLEFSIDGPLNGNLKTALKARGTNPDFGDRPIELNINLEGALGSALSQAINPAAFTATKAQEALSESKTKKFP